MAVMRVIALVDVTIPLYLLLLQLYHQENIYLVLVGVEVWTEGDLIAVNGSDNRQTLTDFCIYRQKNISVYHNNDNAQLLTYVVLLWSATFKPCSHHTMSARSTHPFTLPVIVK